MRSTMPMKLVEDLNLCSLDHTHIPCADNCSLCKALISRYAAVDNIETFCIIHDSLQELFGCQYSRDHSLFWNLDNNSNSTFSLIVNSNNIELLKYLLSSNSFEFQDAICHVNSSTSYECFFVLFQSWKTVEFRNLLLNVPEASFPVSDHLIMAIFSFLPIKEHLTSIVYVCSHWLILLSQYGSMGGSLFTTNESAMHVEYIMWLGTTRYGLNGWKSAALLPTHDEADNAMSLILNNASLQAISLQSTSLVSLDLSSLPNVSNSALNLLSTKCSSLKVLKLAQCECEDIDAAMRMFGEHCPLIEFLSLSGCYNLHSLPLFKSLKSLNISFCSSIAGECVISIANNCAFLEHIDMSGCTHLTDFALFAIGASCRNLKSLKLSECSSFKDTGILSVAARCKQLNELDISRCSFTEHTLLATISRLKNISILSLRECLNMSDTVAASIFFSCSNLKILDISWCLELSSDAIPKVFGAINIERLNLSECINLSDDAVNSIVSYCPNIRCLSINGCEKLTDESINGIVAYCKSIKELNANNIPLLSDEAKDIVNSIR